MSQIDGVGEKMFAIRQPTNRPGMDCGRTIGSTVNASDTRHWMFPYEIGASSSVSAA